MKKLSIIILFLLSHYLILAQNNDIILSGSVLEKGTSKAIPFANIGLVGYPIGTVSNEQGAFEFHIPAKYVNETIAISCIGFASEQFVVKEIKNRHHFEIFLNSKRYDLAAFTVRSEKLAPWDIVQKAIENIPQNYITQPIMMDGFYREYFQENDKYVAFAEAAISIYDMNSYGNKKKKEKEIVTIDQIRVSDICNKGQYVLYIDINYALRSNIVRNIDYWTRFVKKSKLELMQLSIDSLSYYGDDLVYCMSYETLSEKRGRFKGQVFIRTTDFGILRLEINAENTLKGRSLNGAPHNSKAILTYSEYKDKLYLSYINASHKVDYQVRNESYKLVFNSELLINDIKTSGFKHLTPNQHIEEVSIFYQPRYRTFDPNFWIDYNLFEKSLANQQIIQDLQTHRPLHEQYKANGKLKIEANQIKKQYAKSYQPASNIHFKGTN